MLQALVQTNSETLQGNQALLLSVLQSHASAQKQTLSQTQNMRQSLQWKGASRRGSIEGEEEGEEEKEEDEEEGKGEGIGGVGKLRDEYVLEDYDAEYPFEEEDGMEGN